MEKILPFFFFFFWCCNSWGITREEAMVEEEGQWSLTMEVVAWEIVRAGVRRWQRKKGWRRWLGLIAVTEKAA